MSATPPATRRQLTAEPGRQALMTVGQLSRRAGLSHKAIRELEGRGLIYTVGRSESNYRLFDESTLWCVRTIAELRGLGLTLAQIEALRDDHRAESEQPIEVRLHQILNDVRARLTARVDELQATIARIDASRTPPPHTAPRASTGTPIPASPPGGANDTARVQ